MLIYELKKIFVKRSGKIAVLLLLLLLGITSYFTVCDVEYINEQGQAEKGFSAVRMLRQARKEWEGELTEERLARVIEENSRINATPEFNSDDVQMQDIAYGWKQGIYDIRAMLVRSFGKFRDYDYYLADRLEPEDASEFYDNRVLQLKEWLDGEAKDTFSEKEKAFLINCYESIETPFYYDYFAGWDELFEFFPTVIMITVLILGFLAAGIFSGEFQMKTDAIFFSSYHGRGKASAAKLGAGFLIVTVVYWVMVLLYTGIVLGYLGADGAGLVIQTSGRGWKSFYNITNWQEYLLIVFGGYLGSLFMLVLVMLVSAKFRSATLAVMVPFILIFLPAFLQSLPYVIVSKICALLPDQLLQMNLAVCYFSLYQIGEKVVGAVPILLVIYLLLVLLLCPVIYQGYRKAEVR